MKTTKGVFTLFIAAIALISLANCGGGSMNNSTGGSSGGSNSGTSVLSYEVTDSCNDGNTIYYRFFDETNNLQWPSPATSYYYGTEGNTYTSNLQCKTGANICIGASEDPNTEPPNTPYWGVGVDNAYKGEPTSSNTCTVCAATTYPLTLICSAGSSSSLRSSDIDRQRSIDATRNLAPNRLGQE
jgi:hypothetical protein